MFAISLEDGTMYSVNRRLSTGEVVQMNPVFPRYQDAAKFLVDHKYPPEYRIKEVTMNLV